MLKVLFAGTPSTAADVLENLVHSYNKGEKEFRIIGALTREDAPVGRKKVLTASAVAVAAEKNNIPVIKANKITADVREAISAVGADIAVVVAYGVLFDQETLDLLSEGWVNLHYSLLPCFRGAAPVQASIAAGDRETGVTLFAIDAGMDTGNIYCQKTVLIASEETASELLERLTAIGSEELVTFLDAAAVAHQNHTPLEQYSQEVVGKEPSYAPKITPAQAHIEWNQATQEVSNHIRSVSNVPGAWNIIAPSQDQEIVNSSENRTAKQENRFKIHAIGSVFNNKRPTDAIPGQLFSLGKQLFCATTDGAIELLAVQPAGKPVLEASTWLQGIKGSGQTADEWILL